MRKILIGCLLFSATGCYQAPDFYNYEYPEFARDVGPENENVKDNKIYTASLIQEYQARFVDSTGQEKKIVTFYDFQARDPLNWKYMDVPTGKVLSSEYPIDGVRLKVLKNTANAIQAGQQTMIVYEYFNEKGTIIPITELSGLTEDSSKVFLFPPRNSGFALLELAPFPEVEYPIEVGKTWQDNLTASEEWSVATRIPFESTLYFYSTYQIDKKTSLRLPFTSASVPVWEVSAESESRKGTTYSTFYFSESYGFVKMKMTFWDGSTMELDMVRHSQ